MSQSSSTWSRHALALTVAAALLSAMTMGSRTSLGLFVGPINSATGFGVASVSFALALSFLFWGAAQPVLGLVAARYGAARVLAGGALLTALGSVLVALSHDILSLTASMTLVGIAVAAAGSPPLLLGLVAQGVAPSQRGVALGIVGAGGSIGQLLLAPVTALAITSFGWTGAMLALGLLALAALPLARVFRSSDGAAMRAPQSLDDSRAVSRAESRAELLAALRSRDYWLVTAGFFVCGFHVTFLTTHMPGVVELCGFSPTFAGVWLAIVGACNIAGSIGSGWLMQRVSMKSILTTLYALRALGVALFLLAPKTEFVLLAFALWMGLSYMATLPPTTGLIATMFGTRHIGVLLGVTMAVHQVGGFLGAWFGGLERQWTGGYTYSWLLDLALALAAALVYIPIRERAKVGQEPAPAPTLLTRPINRRPSAPTPSVPAPAAR